MKLNNILTKVISYGVVALIIFTLPFVNSDYKKQEAVVEKISFNVEDVVSIYPDATYCKVNSDLSHSVINSSGEEIAKVIVSTDFLESNFGYAGEVNMMIGVRGGIIDTVVLLANDESRGYVRRIERKGLFGAWNGAKFEEVPNMQVDIISGATFTSEAVIKAVKESAAAYNLVSATSNKFTPLDWVKLLLFVVVIALSMVVSFRKELNRFRIAYLIVIIVVVGFFLQNILSVVMFDGWIKQGFSLTKSYMSVAILLMALIMPMLGRPRFYCTFLCPMGALQELTSKVSPFKKYSLKFLRWKYISANDIYLLFVVVAMYTSLNIDFTDLEPFAAFAVAIATWAMLIFGGVVVVLSLFFNRPWCAVCPTGCALNHLSLPKKKKK